MLGIDRSTYCYYELGKIKPDINTIMKLAAIFKVHYTEILESESTTQLRSDSRVDSVFQNNDVSGFFSLSYDEQCLLVAWRLLSENARQEVLKDVVDKFKKRKMEDLEEETKK